MTTDQLLPVLPGLPNFQNSNELGNGTDLNKGNLWTYVITPYVRRCKGDSLYFLTTRRDYFSIQVPGRVDRGLIVLFALDATCLHSRSYTTYTITYANYFVT